MILFGSLIFFLIFAGQNEFLNSLETHKLT